MMTADWMTHVDNWLWRAQLTSASGAERAARQVCRVLYAVIRELASGRVTLHAMGLVYTTLLSIVPLLALSFSVLKGFGVHNQMRPMLEGILLEPLGDERGPEVIDSIITFVDNVEVGVLGSVGLAFLVYTVISLVQKIERSFNEIWRVSKARSFGQRFSSYLSVIMVGPVLGFAALGATAAFVGSDFVQTLTEYRPFGWLFTFAGRIAPYVFIIALFTFLYVFIPHTRVQLRYAFVGGLVAGVTWETMGFAFTVFLANTTSKYAAIYSGFAVGIIMLIWVYLMWLILLLGASVAYYAQHARQITKDAGHLPSATVDERTGLTLVYRAAKRFDNDGGGLPIHEIDTTLSVGPDVIKRVMNKLIRQGLLIIAGDDSDQLIPAHSLDKITLMEVISVLRAPEQPVPASLSEDAPVVDVADQIERSLKDNFKDETLADWIRR